MSLVEISRMTKMKKNKPKLGTGTRFKQLTSKLSRQGVKNPKALAAFYWKKKIRKKKIPTISR